MTYKNKPLKHFLYNCLIVMSWISLLLWGITSGLMVDGFIPIIDGWVIWTLLIVPFNSSIALAWSFRVVMLGKPIFYSLSEK